MLHSFVSGARERRKERKKESRPKYSRSGADPSPACETSQPKEGSLPLPSSFPDASACVLASEVISEPRWRFCCCCVWTGADLCSAPVAALSPGPHCSWLCSGLAEGDARRSQACSAAACAPTSRLLSNDSEINSPPDGWAHACGGSQRSSAPALMLAPSASLSKLRFSFDSSEGADIPGAGSERSDDAGFVFY